MPQPIEISLGEIEPGELLRDLHNQVWEMQKDAEQYLALQVLRRARWRRWTIVYRARALPPSLPRSANSGAWVKPLVKEVAVLCLHPPVGDQLYPAHQPVP